jgi:hypothetical protein
LATELMASALSQKKGLVEIDGTGLIAGPTVMAAEQV